MILHYIHYLMPDLQKKGEQLALVRAVKYSLEKYECNISGMQHIYTTVRALCIQLTIKNFFNLTNNALLSQME